MKDPLHRDNPFDALLGKDNYKPGGEDVTTVCKVLLGWANLSNKEQFDSGKPRPKWHRERSEMAHRLLARLHRYGVTKALADELNGYLENVVTIANMTLDYKSRKVEWNFVMRRSLENEKKTQIAFWIAALLERGELDGLAKCEMPGCGNFFVGTARKRWCSNACGTKYRVRKKRRLDKERQML